jgi:hypothetical protein
VSFTKKASAGVAALALATGGLVVAAGVATAHDHHGGHGGRGHHGHSHDSDSNSRREQLQQRPDPQGVGGPQASASSFTPGGVPVVGATQAAAGATKALPSGPDGDGQSGGGY